MNTLPLFHRMQGVPCLVVGGGDIAVHKARMLVRAGADLRMVATEFSPATNSFVEEHGITRIQRPYQTSDLNGVRLVIAATDNERVNQQIAKDAQAKGLLTNVVDKPDLSNIIFPSILDRSPLVIAVGSDGSAPVLVRLLRARLETLIPATYGALAALVGRFRDRVRQTYPDMEKRRRFWDKHLQGRVAELVHSGQEAKATELLEDQLAGGAEAFSEGEVYLVGAGPGDPDLLTFRALRLMQQADVVLHDRLVSNAVLDLVRRESEKIYVGKDKNPYSITQENINEVMVDWAQQGKRVLRLKGGDPFIFGRGGEEMEHLARHGINFQVVPGITAASGCASYAGIPLTHRDYAQSVRFITGHKVGGELNLDWNEFVRSGQTLVFYMGLNGLETICDKLVEYGMASNMPVALVEKGTLPDQRVFTGTLTDLPAKVREAGAEAPTLIIVGEVVRLHDVLSPGEREYGD